VQLTHVNVGEAKVDLRFWREDGQTYWKVAHQVGKLDVVESDRLK
jgi:hypothetical protein